MHFTCATKNAARAILSMPIFPRMQIVTTMAAAVAAAGVLAACSSNKMSDLSSPSVPTLNMDFTPYSKATVIVPAATRAVVTPADFVNADGTCAASSQGPAAIELGMTECGLVQRAGPPEKLELGSNQRGERTVTILYSRGERPGLYSFTAGLLTSIERVGAPPPAPKPQKPAKPAPRRATP
jgi:outer membrane murein-binding lipoprotein Lpp